jgi:hypothetical protein
MADLFAFDLGQTLADEKCLADITARCWDRFSSGGLIDEDGVAALVDALEEAAGVEVLIASGDVKEADFPVWFRAVLEAALRMQIAEANARKGAAARELFAAALC